MMPPSGAIAGVEEEAEKPQYPFSPFNTAFSLLTLLNPPDFLLVFFPSAPST